MCTGGLSGAAVSLTRDLLVCGAPFLQVVYKWLTAARRRLGGVFPRPFAKDEMEAHAKSLRNARANRARRLAEKKKAADAGVGALVFAAPTPNPATTTTTCPTRLPHSSVLPAYPSPVAAPNSPCSLLYLTETGRGQPGGALRQAARERGDQGSGPTVAAHGPGQLATAPSGGVRPPPSGGGILHLPPQARGRLVGGALGPPGSSWVLLGA